RCAGKRSAPIPATCPRSRIRRRWKRWGVSSPPEDRLDGQVALVTGGGRGIGRRIAVELASAGARVAVSARTADQVEETADQIGGLAIAAGGADRDEVARLVVELAGGLGRL